MARLLKDAKGRASEDLESDDDLENRIKAEFLPKLVQRLGTSTLIEKTRKLQKERDDVEKELNKLGFECDEDDVWLKYDAPKNLSQALEEAQRSAKKERDAELRKYDKAILNVSVAETPAEAKKIVEELL